MPVWLGWSADHERRRCRQQLVPLTVGRARMIWDVGNHRTWCTDRADQLARSPVDVQSHIGWVLYTCSPGASAAEQVTFKWPRVRLSSRARVRDCSSVVYYGRARTVPLFTARLRPCGRRDRLPSMLSYGLPRDVLSYGPRGAAGRARVRVGRRDRPYEWGGSLDLYTVRVLWPWRGRRRPWGPTRGLGRSYSEYSEQGG